MRRARILASDVATATGRNSRSGWLPRHAVQREDVMKGRCVICGNLGALTRDHVPPQGIVPPAEIEVTRLLPLASPDDDDALTRPRRHFRSPSFPSLCKQCNGDRLGREYDPHLIRLARAVRSWVNTAYNIGLSLPESIPVQTVPHRVGRAVVGHLLAVEERKDRTAELNNGSMLDELRKYFLDTQVPFPARAAIYLWPYPSDDIVIARGFGIARPGVFDVIVGDVLKFFPLAFWVVSETPPGIRFPFTRLPFDRADCLDTTVTFSIPLRGIPPIFWPERPSSNELVLGRGERMHLGRQVRRRRRP
jgi:hypothetical protein